MTERDTDKDGGRQREKTMALGDSLQSQQTLTQGGEIGAQRGGEKFSQTWGESPRDGDRHHMRQRDIKS